MSTKRITICLDAKLKQKAEAIADTHAPFVRRHRLLRLAIRYGLSAFELDPELVKQEFGKDIDARSHGD